MARPDGSVSLERLLDALNSLSEEQRAPVLAALREHRPGHAILHAP